MKQVFMALMTSMFLLGISSMSSAFDLDMGKMTGHAEELKGEASDKGEELTSKGKELTSKGEEKKNQVMGEAKEQNITENVKAQGKEMINEKVDEVQGNMLGQ